MWHHIWFSEVEDWGKTPTFQSVPHTKVFIIIIIIITFVNFGILWNVWERAVWRVPLEKQQHRRPWRWVNAFEFFLFNFFGVEQCFSMPSFWFCSCISIISVLSSRCHCYPCKTYWEMTLWRPLKSVFCIAPCPECLHHPLPDNSWSIHLNIRESKMCNDWIMSLCINNNFIYLLLNYSFFSACSKIEK